MKQRIFYAADQRPAFGQQANELIRYFDLGLEGAYVGFAHKLTADLADGISDEKLSQQTPGIKTAYEQAGCVRVKVVAEKPRPEEEG